MAKTEILFCLSKFTFIPSIRVKNSAVLITVTLVWSVILGLDLFLNLKIQSLHVLAEQYCYGCAFLTHGCRQNYFLRTSDFVSWLLHYCSPQQRSSPPCPMSILIVTLIYIIPLSLILHVLLVSKTFTCLLTQGSPQQLTYSHWHPCAFLVISLQFEKPLVK